jgi:hypothetical protein
MPPQPTLVFAPAPVPPAPAPAPVQFYSPFPIRFHPKLKRPTVNQVDLDNVMSHFKDDSRIPGLIQLLRTYTDVPMTPDNVASKQFVLSAFRHTLAPLIPFFHKGFSPDNLDENVFRVHANGVGTNQLVTCYTP